MLGIEAAPVTALVQGVGRPGEWKQRVFSGTQPQPATAEILNRYLYVTLTQLAQTAACTRFHLVERGCAVAADDARPGARR